MNKAELTRIVELSRLVIGMPTERPLADILRAEREVAKKYLVTPTTTGQAQTPTEIEATS